MDVKENKEVIKKKRVKYDSEYIAYVERGDSAAVFVARDRTKGINLEGKWIHILSHDGQKKDDGVWDFKHIHIELVPRKTNPFYPKGVSEEDKKRITWEAATADIEEFKKSKKCGSKYKIDVKLEDINNYNNKSGYTVSYYSRKYHCFLDEPKPNADCELRIKNTTKPKWEYTVLSVKRI